MPSKKTRCGICNRVTELGFRTFFGIKQNEGADNKIIGFYNYHFCWGCTKRVQSAVEEMRKGSKNGA